jgi:chemotaxis protein methyltransferase CheR
MTALPAEIAELAHLVETVSGNVIPPGHFPFLLETATTRARANSLSTVGEYVRALARGALPGEWKELLPHITIKESFFFRTPQHFKAVASVLLPRLIAARAARRRLLVWSAGCARGEESATLAIVLAECAELVAWDWRIDATDVDEEALAAARTGLYGDRAVSQVPPDLQEKYLKRTDAGFELVGALRRHVDYRPFNLIAEPFLLPPQPYDLIFLRNVLIYFRVESQRRVVACLARSLARDGYLFLGPSETLWQINDDLEPEDLGDSFCYHHRSAAADPPRREHAHRRPSSAAAPPLTAPQPMSPRPSRPVSAPLDTAVPPLEKPAASQGTESVLASVAALLAAGKLSEAGELIERALGADPSDPAAHTLEGFLHDVEGRLEQALASYRAALFLDAGLYQTRFLLAETLRRLGHHPRAAHEYREVLATLAGGRARALEVLAALPVPDRDQARRRSQQALSLARQS